MSRRLFMGHTPDAAARLGCALAASALGGVGPQDYEFCPERLLAALASAYGEPPAGALAPDLRRVARPPTR